MPSVEAALVDIVREFLTAHQLMRSLFARYRDETLEFAELAQLISDDEQRVLFRLKERCHSLFRVGEYGDRVPDHREALFDLAVGSLFHEAMSFRENFYQREVYGPRMRALRSEAGAEAEALFGEFERILASVSDRLSNGLQEVDGLIDRTRDQLGVLLVDHAANGHLSRYLIENEDLVGRVFDEGLERLLSSIHGSAELGYESAALSYLRSGYYTEAEATFAEAMRRGGDPTTLEPKSAYAAGMRAFLNGDYTASVERLRAWGQAGEPDRERRLASVAAAALSRIGKFLDAEEHAALIEEAGRVLESLGGAPSAEGYAASAD